MNFEHFRMTWGIDMGIEIMSSICQAFDTEAEKNEPKGVGTIVG